VGSCEKRRRRARCPPPAEPHVRWSRFGNRGRRFSFARQPRTGVSGLPRHSRSWTFPAKSRMTVPRMRERLRRLTGLWGKLWRGAGVNLRQKFSIRCSRLPSWQKAKLCARRSPYICTRSTNALPSLYKPRRYRSRTVLAGKAEPRPLSFIDPGRAPPCGAGLYALSVRLATPRRTR
jgi:hypothetical protein